MSWQLNLDGFALPIKQLKGTEPVDKLEKRIKALLADAIDEPRPSHSELSGPGQG